MSILDVREIKNELVVLLRNSNILSTSERGVQTTTQTFVGNNILKSFTVSNLSIKNVRSVTVNDVTYTYGTDYTVNYNTGTITFEIAPANLADIDITYDYGADKIFGEIPRIDISLSSYPRVAVQFTASRTSEGALDGSVNFTDYLLSIYIYAENSNKVEDIAYLVRSAILTNKKNIHYLRYITIVGETSIRNEDGRHNKIEFKTIDLVAPLNEEIN